MILRHAPVLESLIGMDAPSGWLPLGAVEPLPSPPHPALLDVRIYDDGNRYCLEWRAHHSLLGKPPSASGLREFDSFALALAAAEIQFEPVQWLHASDGAPPSAGTIALLRDAVFAAHKVDSAQSVCGLRVVEPRRERFRILEHEPTDVWVLLEPEDAGGYVIFYDDADGGCGMGSRS